MTDPLVDLIADRLFAFCIELHDVYESSEAYEAGVTLARKTAKELILTVELSRESAKTAVKL